MVLLEALARRRPVIVFDEIKHIIGDKKGILFRTEILVVSWKI